MQKCSVHGQHYSEVRLTAVMTASFFTPKKNVLGLPRASTNPIRGGIVNIPKVEILEALLCLAKTKK